MGCSITNQRAVMMFGQNSRMDGLEISVVRFDVGDGVWCRLKHLEKYHLIHFFELRDERMKRGDFIVSKGKEAERHSNERLSRLWNKRSSKKSSGSRDVPPPQAGIVKNNPPNASQEPQRTLRFPIWFG